MLGGPGGCWLGRETRQVLSALEGLGLGYCGRMTGERGLYPSSRSPGGGTLSLTHACPPLWQGALLVASGMGSITLKPPACANPQGNPSPPFEVRAGNGCGGTHPFFAKVRARVRTPGSPHSLSPQNQTTAASRAPSPPLCAAPVRTLLRQHLFWVCWLHQRLQGGAL